MTVVNATGTRLDEAACNALTSAATNPAPMRVFSADVYQRYAPMGARGERGNRLLFRAGQVVPQAAIDAVFQDATADSITPATGPAAGGTDVVIKGGGFGGVSGVTFGGTAATLVTIVDETTLTARAPAHAAGAVSVVIADDSGALTKTSFFTYV